MIDKFKLQLTAGVILIGITIMACKKTEQITNKNQTISPDILTSIGQLGFNTDNVIMRKEGYLVEGDILLTDDNLKQKSQSPNLRIAECEQYRTINMVRAPRVINVAVFNNLPGIFFQAADSAIARYNALHLSIRFQRVATEGDINIIGFDEAPDGWLQTFDKFDQVQDRYSITLPDGGIAYVHVTPEVKDVLHEIKKMPRRRVTGKRAESFLHNPFSMEYL